MATCADVGGAEYPKVFNNKPITPEAVVPVRNPNFGKAAETKPPAQKKPQRQQGKAGPGAS